MGLNKRLIDQAGGAAGVVNTDNFDVVTYTGNQTARTISTTNDPDLVWIKDRSVGNFHAIFDSVRGTAKAISSNSNAAEVNYGSDGVTSFNTGGFDLSNSGTDWNTTNDNYVAWCFKGGGSAVSNTDGVTSGSVTAVTSTVSANQDTGFSICEFTTPSSGKLSWGHGLSQAPELIIVKNAGGTGNWLIYAPSILGQKELRFTLAAASSYSPDFISADSSKIDLGSNSFNIGGSSRHINYNFHSVDGYQKVGSYTGDGNASQDITTGFQPRFLLVKDTSASSHWFVYDSERGVGENTTNVLLANNSTTELTGREGVEFLTDGFRMYDGDNYNISENIILYLAIA